MPLAAAASEARTMFDLILAGATAAGLLAYLVWALLCPEDL